MKTENAIKKLNSLGFGTVSQNRNMYTLKINLHEISVTDQVGEVIAIHTQRVTDQADSQSDYFPGQYWDTLKRAVDCMTRPEYLNEKMCGCGKHVAQHQGLCLVCLPASRLSEVA